MSKKNYKYTLLENSSETNVEKSESSPWKIVIFSVLTIIIVLYYVNHISNNINEIKLLEKNLKKSSEAPEMLTDSIRIQGLKLEFLQNTTSLTNVSVTHLTKKVLNSKAPTNLTSSATLNIQKIPNKIIKFSKSSAESATTSPVMPMTVESLYRDRSREITSRQEMSTHNIATSSSNIPIDSTTSPIINIQTFQTQFIKFPNSTTSAIPTTSTFRDLTDISYIQVHNITTPHTISMSDVKPPTRQIKIQKNFKPQKYFVNTDQCHMPWVDPFGPAVKKIFKPQKYKDCSKDKALISSVFNETQRRYILNINYERVEDISCCYQQIVRTGSGANADKKYKLLPCSKFHQNFTVPQHIDAMIIECKSRNTTKTIQKDAFSFIQDRTPNLELIESNDITKKPNVLLIGIDSLSRFNFRRNMPKTAEFLMKNNWFELQGYNKVGDNTFPNLMPFLTGFNESIGYSKCAPKSVGGLDKCNFIWKDFKVNGYETAYAEDETVMSTFNYLKKGFEKLPTDYYLRPMMLAIENNMSIEKKSGMKFCIGRRHAAEYIYDFGLEFAKRHQKKPGFGLFWTNSFSHNSYDTASSMDVQMLKYFEAMKNNGIFENSIVIFFSDHGVRWGSLLKLAEGFLEERLPMFFMKLPKWFYEIYPDYVKALKINANRLTTPFDIYQTLKHILSLNQTSKNTMEPAFSCPTAQSIFYEVSKNRTCEDACIPEHWCTCSPYEVISPKSSEVKHITDLIVDEINNYLKTNNFSSLCVPLQRQSIEEVFVKMEMPGTISHTETLRIKFKVKPKDAEFQVTAVYDLEKHKVDIVIEDISRLDSYAPHSKCIDNKLAKKFCMCKS